MKTYFYAIRTICFSAVFIIIACFNTMSTFAADGWKQENGKSYYVQNKQILTNQWFKIEQKVHYEQKSPSEPFKEDTVSINWYYAGSDGNIYKNGWYDIDGNFYYFNNSGVNIRKNWINIEGDRYYVNENGIRQQNGWFSITNINSKGEEYTNWYYAKLDGILYRNGWYEIDEKTCYFDINGNSPRKNWVNIGTDRYRVDEEGNLQTGWFCITSENAQGVKYENWYLAQENGILMRNGWHQLGDDWYYFDANGLNYRKRWYVNPNTKERYYMDESGVLQDDGWFSVKGKNAQGVEYENWYYAKEDGSVYTDCYETIDGKYYGFDANGLMYKKRWIMIESNRYLYADENGIIARNGWFNIITQDTDGNSMDNWYYADASGLVHRTEESHWSTINGKRYYLSASGKQNTGWVDDKISFCGEDGVALEGWQYLKIPDSWIDDSNYISDYVNEHGNTAYFYFSPLSAKKKYSISSTYKIFTIDKAEYCFDKYGIMQTGWVKYTSKNPVISGYRYFETAEEGQGKAVLSQWRYLECPKELEEFSEDGWYYFGANGSPYTTSIGKDYVIREIEGKNYLFDKYGRARQGLVKINGEFYYFGVGRNGLEGGTGRITIEDGIDVRAVYFFNSGSKGVTGIRNGYFYYKGKLQTANEDIKYQVFEVPDIGKRLVDSKGKVVKGKKVKDNLGQEWIVSGNGRITAFGDSKVAELNEPEELLLN